MKVFKFGGASTATAAGVKNVVSLLKQSKESDLVVVISAMGKITNALEEVVLAWFAKNGLKEALEKVSNFHYEMAANLFQSKTHAAYVEVDNIIKELLRFLEINVSENHAFVYDQVVSYGEILASKIVSRYFDEVGLSNTWLDVCTCIKTDDNYRDAKVNWKLTQKNIKNKVSPKGITVTQGFIGSDAVNNFTTTLGREGSDYTAAIFAHCLDAEDVTIWKDVPGFLNADPRYFKQTQLLHKISYKEAVELAFYGAFVVHPKTLQPLQQKEIPLYIKSFLDFDSPGTCVGGNISITPKITCYILKPGVTLISLSSHDFGFIMEDYIADVFKWLYEYKMKVELIQNSAISFSVCVSDKFNNLHHLLEKLRSKFYVKWNEDVTLYTLRHFEEKDVKRITEGKRVLLKQVTQETVQLIIQDKPEMLK